VISCRVHRHLSGEKQPHTVHIPFITHIPSTGKRRLRSTYLEVLERITGGFSASRMMLVGDRPAGVLELIGAGHIYFPSTTATCLRRSVRATRAASASRSWGALHAGSFLQVRTGITPQVPGGPRPASAVHLDTLGRLSRQSFSVELVTSHIRRW
jgi:hypothetical protein